MSRKQRVPAWLVMAHNSVHCTRCGALVPVPLPMPVDAFGAWVAYVGALHALCRDNGPLPAPCSVAEWQRGPDTGLSSLAIYHHMQGWPDVDGFPYPRDPSDFGRCYRLLKLAPEWRVRMGEMAAYGKEWTALAGAWDELTVLYESEVERGNAPKLYARMKELAAPAADGGAA